MSYQPNQPQLPVRCYNPIHVLWTDEECEYLLDQRMSRNGEYWSLASGGRARFWRDIARKINEVFGTRFRGDQVLVKWKNLKQSYLVSRFYAN
jgi:hypothetical protein